MMCPFIMRKSAMLEHFQYVYSCLYISATAYSFYYIPFYSKNSPVKFLFLKL